jgi:CPA2 family monovalent cation:H+ antiporter-2
MHGSALIATVAAGFTVAWLFGLLTQWLRLSPIIGYLIAGVLIGPYTPGFVGDIHLAQELAEIGVILLMFGVGLHFHLDDLLAVKGIAVPGALGQSITATLVSIPVFMLFGIDPRTGAVLGMAMAVASTVVLIRVLTDAEVLNSTPGHIAVGWLLVEDLITVLVLVLIPVMGAGRVGAAAPGSNPAVAFAVVVLKLAAMIAIVLIAGSRLVPWVLIRVARLRSRELFTLTVLVFSVSMAAGAYVAFGASMALGAFLAGMLVAQSPVSHQAAADALPLRDAFSVLFFVSVGMLFDPVSLLRSPAILGAAMGIILLVKPLTALIIVGVLGHSVRTALTVAIGLAQIGEFSFILSDAARKFDLMPDSLHNVLVAGAILSIAMNPLLFRTIDGIERSLRRRPALWAFLNARAERKAARVNVSVGETLAHRGAEPRLLAVIIGFGPVGSAVNRLLRDRAISTVVVDLNVDTILDLERQEQPVIFGDATREAILESAGVRNASHVIVTVPQATSRPAIVLTARNINPGAKILVRAHYLQEREELEQSGATAAIYEEGEAAVALARLVLADTGASRESIEHAVRDIRMRLILENVSGLSSRKVREVMIPWTRVRRLSYDAVLADVREELAAYSYSRWPVVKPETGAVTGYLLASDLIRLRSDDVNWNNLVRPIDAAAPDDDLESTLLRFQRHGAAIYLVKERESPVGIITIEDILEQVVGRIQIEREPRERAALRDVILTNNALLNLSGTTTEEVIAEMVRKIPRERMPRDVDVVDLVIAREREMPTNIGGGVAIPHARCPGLKASLVAFGRSWDGVLFNERSPELVHLIFMLLTPLERVDEQVFLLNDVASIAGDPEKRQQLLEATVPTDIIRIVDAHRQL